ncbi:MAG: type II and III secretion system protein family protein [Desulfobacterales bacterium]
MFMPRRFWISGTVLFGLASILLIFSTGTWAGDNVQPEFQKPQFKLIELAVGKSDVLPIPESIKKSDHIRVTIAAPEIADFLFIPKVNRKSRVKNIYIKGKKAGATTLTLWKNGELLYVYDVEVNYDISLLKQRLHEALPDERDIRVFATKDSITLAGTISSTENLNQVMVLAEAFTGKGKIINLLKVAGGQQVMLEVKIAEMSRRVSKRLGINFSAVGGTGDIGINIIGGLGSFFTDGALDSASEDVTGYFKFDSPGHNVTYTGVIDFLKGNGLVKILAEPTLIALSGQTANFLAGGEFPVPDIDDEGNIGVEFRPYGVELAFLPTVLSEKRIAIKVEPAVTELDTDTGTNISGAFVPGLITRKATTMVELADGQSFAIAGILQESTRDNISKYPGLGDIPILGALFKSTSFQKNETELVIIVTPHLVKPLNMAGQSLPTDFYIEPDDAEFYLWGIFGQSQKASVGEAELEGEFGHIFEKKE